jgi:hypothetical protein
MEVAGGPHWYSAHVRNPDASEDFAFCLRLMDAGITLHMDTSVKATHHKDVWLSERHYLAGASR